MKTFLIFFSQSDCKYLSKWGRKLKQTLNQLQTTFEKIYLFSLWKLRDMKLARKQETS